MMKLSEAIKGWDAFALQDYIKERVKWYNETYKTHKTEKDFTTIHIHTEDECLPDDNPLRIEAFCRRCAYPVYCGDELMTPWVEHFYEGLPYDGYKIKACDEYDERLGEGVYCLECFIILVYFLKEIDRPPWLDAMKGIFIVNH